MNSLKYFNNACALTSICYPSSYGNTRKRKVTFLFLAINSIMTYLLTSLAEPMLPLIAAVTADRLLPLLTSAEQNVHKYILDHY